MGSNIFILGLCQRNNSEIMIFLNDITIKQCYDSLTNKKAKIKLIILLGLGLDESIQKNA